MKVIKATGLVPVRVLTLYGPHRAGAIFGLTPEQTSKALETESVELYPIAEGIETVDVAVRIPAPPRTDPKAVTTTAVPFVEGPAPIEIPADWAQKHYLQRIKLAKDIAGETWAVPDGTSAKDHADKIIAAELARRT